jgi:hypothetical protein
MESTSPKTHDLDYLIRLADQCSVTLDPAVIAANWLTPWAAEFRYDDAPIDTLDRTLAVEAAQGAVAWCHDLLVEATSSLPSAGQSPDPPR